MSVSEDDDDELVDTVRPGGQSTIRGPNLVFMADDTLFENGKGAIYDPGAIDKGEDAWIRADRDAFVEVGQQ